MKNNLDNWEDIFVFPTVEDYTDSISKNIESLDEIEKMINRTSKEIDKIIRDFKDEYKEYIGKHNQVNELLNSFERIKYEIKDREEEIKNIKKEQKKELEKNKEKVKTLNDEIII